MAVEIEIGCQTAITITGNADNSPHFWHYYWERGRLARMPGTTDIALMAECL